MTTKKTSKKQKATNQKSNQEITEKQESKQETKQESKQEIKQESKEKMTEKQETNQETNQEMTEKQETKQETNQESKEEMTEKQENKQESNQDKYSYVSSFFRMNWMQKITRPSLNATIYVVEQINELQKFSFNKVQDVMGGSYKLATKSVEYIAHNSIRPTELVLEQLEKIKGTSKKANQA